MTDYKPDRWVLVRLPENRGYKVLAEWKGGYLYGDSWRLNSGITKITESKTHYDLHGYSSSVYTVNKELYGISGVTAFGVLKKLLDNGCEQVAEENINDVINEINKK